MKNNISSDFESHKRFIRLEVKKLMSDWVTCFENQNLQGILEFYDTTSKDFSFIHGQSEKVAKNHEALKVYFKNFFDKDAIKVHALETELSFPLITNSAAVITGQSAIVTRKSRKILAAQTYFTITFKLHNNGLKIIHHHSTFPEQKQLRKKDAETSLEDDPIKFYIDDNLEIAGIKYDRTILKREIF